MKQTPMLENRTVSSAMNSFRRWASYFSSLPLFLCMGMVHAQTIAPSADFPSSVYVTVQGANAVEEFPSRRVYNGLVSAHYDAVSKDGKILIAGNYTTGDVHIVNTESGKKLATFKIGTSVQGVNITPDEHWAMAVDPNGGRVAVIDLKTLKLVKFIKVGEIPHNIAFTTNSKTAYVTLQGGTGVAVIDMQTLKKNQ